MIRSSLYYVKQVVLSSTKNLGKLGPKYPYSFVVFLPLHVTKFWQYLYVLNPPSGGIQAQFFGNFHLFLKMFFFIFFLGCIQWYRWVGGGWKAEHLVGALRDVLSAQRECNIHRFSCWTLQVNVSFGQEEWHFHFHSFFSPLNQLILLMPMKKMAISLSYK